MTIECGCIDVSCCYICFCDFSGILELLYTVMNTILEVALKALQLEQLHMGHQFARSILVWHMCLRKYLKSTWTRLVHATPLKLTICWRITVTILVMRLLSSLLVLQYQITFWIFRMKLWVAPWPLSYVSRSSMLIWSSVLFCSLIRNLTLSLPNCLNTWVVTEWNGLKNLYACIRKAFGYIVLVGSTVESCERSNWRKKKA